MLTNFGYFLLQILSQTWNVIDRLFYNVAYLQFLVAKISQLSPTHPSGKFCLAGYSYSSVAGCS